MSKEYLNTANILITHFVVNLFVFICDVTLSMSEIEIIIIINLAQFQVGPTSKLEELDKTKHLGPRGQNKGKWGRHQNLKNWTKQNI